jgi:uncharacterized membrane protein
MTPLKHIRIYGASLATFFLLDLIWLGVVASGFYGEHLGYLLRVDVMWPAAITFYLLFVAGIVKFVTLPALERGSGRHAAWSGAFFGLVTYATFDLTCLALFEGFPLIVVLVDLVWGAVLTVSVTMAGYAYGRRRLGL